jgi:hypothetical protein
MRILVRRIYRAFPELDAYSDEQCARFVRATRRGWARWGHRAVIVLVSAVSFFGVMIGLAFLSSVLERYQNSIRRDVPWMEALIALAAVPLVALVPVSAFLMRDVLLRRRLRWVLRDRSACPKCRYRLIGLAVSAQHTIKCPECGMVCDVDPSISELALDETGKEQYHPAVIAPRKPPFWTKRRRKLVLRTLLVIVLVPSLAALTYEGFLRWQARVARRERPGTAALTALARSLQGDAKGEARNGWDLLGAALAAVDAADQRVWRDSPATTADGQKVKPEPILLYSRGPRGMTSEYENASRELALKMLGEYRADGVFGTLKEMAACGWGVRGLVNDDQKAPLINAQISDWGDIWKLAQINGGRMGVAIKAGQTGEFLEAFEANLAITKMMQRQGLVIDDVVAARVDDLTLARARALMGLGADPATLEAIGAIMRRQAANVPRERVFEGERIAALDTVAWFFEEPSRVRLGKYSKAIEEQFGKLPPAVKAGRLGTYQENRDALNDAFDLARANAGLIPSQRTAPGTTSDLILMQCVRPADWYLTRLMDHHETMLSGTRLMLAIERFRAARGDYPAALKDLVPGFIETLPADPWTGKDFGYVRIDPAADRLHRAYLLYSAGADGKDDGGTEQAQDATDSSRMLPGTDFVINRWDELAEP